MKVLITGGAGHVGKATTERLVKHGWEVRVIGLEAGIEIPGAEFVTCDIMNYGDLREQLRGCDAVVHLAAIPQPRTANARKLFEVNVAGTYNVFEAAAAEGVRRIVQASSINAFGCYYGLTDMSIQYFPINEEHPTFTTDPYSFSKESIESIGRYYWRRDGISSVALRFPAVLSNTYSENEDVRQRHQLMRQVLDALASAPETERRQQLADVRRSVLEYRQQHPFEFRGGLPDIPRRDFVDYPLWHAYAIDRFNFWASIDERDAAQSIERGLTAQYDDAHALFVSADHNWLGYDSRTLVRLFFPEVDESRVALAGSAALVSNDKARKLIGFQPECIVKS